MADGERIERLVLLSVPATVILGIRRLFEGWAAW
jgi:hypothetical protein